MRLTKSLREWAVANCGVKADADDAAIKKAVSAALVEEKLTPEKYAELSKPDGSEGANRFEKQLAALGKTVEKLTTLLTPIEDDADEDEKDTEVETKEVKTKTAKSADAVTKTIVKNGSAREETRETRTKSAIEDYDLNNKSACVYPSVTKTGRPHPKAGQPVFDYQDGGRSVNNPSDGERAVAGAFAMYQCNLARLKGSKTLAFQTLPEHAKSLLMHGIEKMEWGGTTNANDEEYSNRADIKGKLTPVQQKALIDDGTSGGLEAAPIVFDDMVIQAPLLNGELYPLVNTISLDRGRRVEGVATGKVTGSWGGVDDSAIALFNTASYVSAFDTTIFRWEGAIKIGLDFLSDTPIDFGAHVTAQYGERLLEDLDDVIATGNGTTQPEGIMNKSGTTSVNFGGSTSIGNYESLLFGIAKAERRPGLAGSTVFCGTDTSYQRARAIPVGASDARRLGGSQSTTGGVGDYLTYSWMGHPFKINNSMSNQQLFYAILGRYRMYRRRGLTMRTSTEGDTLIRANEMLMVAMARYGGQLERGACAAVTATAPA